MWPKYSKLGVPRLQFEILSQGFKDSGFKVMVRLYGLWQVLGTQGFRLGLRSKWAYIGCEISTKAQAKLKQGQKGLEEKEI